MKGYLKEIFPSIQGEGIFAGVPQIFIRFAKCNLSCKYCDTDFKLSDKFIVKFNELTSEEYSNPVSSSSVVKIVESLPPLPWVSFTGGEPLLQVNFLDKLLSKLKGRGFKLFLETNGTQVSELKRILKLVDHISMDIKLPSYVGSNYFSLHKEFLEVALKKEVEVKIVVGEDASEEEVVRAFEIVSSVSPDIPLTIQPVSGNSKPSISTLLKFHSLSEGKLRKVRILPQVHKLLGWW
jgi:organic radical activating enzyme